MRNANEIKNRFLSDALNHELKVLNCDGATRHLQFRNPKSHAYWFDLITWPGALCVNGDCGCYVFSRLPDMFEFFRRNDLSINPGYWGEKLQSIAREGFEEFSEDRFREAVTDQFNSNFEGCENSVLKADTWKEIEYTIFTEIENGEVAAREAVANFEFKKFTFVDFWEYRTVDYTFHYIWCLYATVWGINKFDLEYNQFGTVKAVPA